MIIQPSIEDMLKKVEDRYVMSVAVAKRARQLINDKDKTLTGVDIDQRSCVKVAIDEINNGDIIVNIKEIGKEEK